MIGSGEASAFMTPIVWLFSALLLSIPARMILHACLVDGTTNASTGIAAFFALIGGVGMLMNGGSFLVVLCGFVLIVMGGAWSMASLFADKTLRKQLRNENIERYERAIQFDDGNASAHAGLAEEMAILNRFEEAIHEYRTAIRTSPDGPQTARWKSALREILDKQQGIDKHDFKVCDSCYRDMPKKLQNCPNCGAVQSVNFLVWAARPQNLLPTLRFVVAISLGITLFFTFLGSIPFMLAGSLIMLLIVAGGWLILRALSP